MSFVRGLLSFLLVLAGLACLAVAVPATWTQRHLFDTERYTAAVAPLIAYDSVQQGVSRALVRATLRDVELPAFAQDAVREASDRLVATDGFARVWEEGVRLSHAELVATARDEGRALSTEQGQLRVDLAPLGEALRARLAEAGVPLVDRMPPVEGSYVLEDSAEVTQALRVAGVVDEWAVPAAVAAVVLLLLGVLVAVRRSRALALTGLAVALLAGAYAVGWAVVSERVLAGTGAGARAQVFTALTDTVLPWLGALGAAGLVLALLGTLAAAMGGGRRPAHP